MGKGYKKGIMLLLYFEIQRNHNLYLDERHELSADAADEDVTYVDKIFVVVVPMSTVKSTVSIWILLYILLYKLMLIG